MSQFYITSHRLLRSGEYNVFNRQNAAKNPVGFSVNFAFFVISIEKQIPRKSRLCIIRFRQRFFKSAKKSVISHNPDSGITSPNPLLSLCLINGGIPNKREKGGGVYFLILNKDNTQENSKYDK